MYRALIVEDEDLMREYLEKNLSTICTEWCVAATAADGQEAIEKMEGSHFDGIITDVRMPVMDGLAMSKVIREKDPQIPILIVSGYNEFDYARKAVRLISLIICLNLLMNRSWLLLYQPWLFRLDRNKGLLL